MQRFLIPSILITLSFALSSCLLAGDVKFEKVDAARKSNLPALIVSYSTSSRFALPHLDNIKEFLKSEVGKVFAEEFSYGEINAFIPDAKQGYRDPEITKVYGPPVSVSVWLPLAEKPLWSGPLKALTYDNAMEPLEEAEMKAGLLSAREAVSKWNDGLQKILTDAGAKKLKDKVLNTPEIQLVLAKHYLSGHVVDECVRYYESALKLMKKKDKKDPQIPTLTLEIADLYFNYSRFDKACATYTAFLKDYKEHERRNEVLLREAETTHLAGDSKKAKAMLEKILKNDELSSMHTDARTLLEQVEIALAPPEKAKG